MDKFMIKIQKGPKIFIIRKVDSFKELKNKFLSKFKLKSPLDFNFCYEDSNGDEITVESDEDLQIAYEFVGKDLKVKVKKKEEMDNTSDFIT